MSIIEDHLYGSDGSSTACSADAVWYETTEGSGSTRRPLSRDATGCVTISPLTTAIVGTCFFVAGNLFVEFRSPAATDAPIAGSVPALLTSSTTTITANSSEATASALTRTMIAKIRNHLDAGQRARAIDVVYDCIDELLLSKSFDEALFVIRTIIRSQFPLPILLSALTISLPWRNALGRARLELVEAVRARALKEGGEEKVKSVLRGLI